MARLVVRRTAERQRRIRDVTGATTRGGLRSQVDRIDGVDASGRPPAIDVDDCVVRELFDGGGGGGGAVLVEGRIDGVPPAVDGAVPAIHRQVVVLAGGAVVVDLETECRPLEGGVVLDANRRTGADAVVGKRCGCGFERDARRDVALAGEGDADARGPVCDRRRIRFVAVGVVGNRTPDGFVTGVSVDFGDVQRDVQVVRRPSLRRQCPSSIECGSLSL